LSTLCQATATLSSGQKKSIRPEILPAHPASHGTAIRLASIPEQANDLQALLFAGADLPVQLSAETLGLLGRLDDDLSELVQRIGEAGPEG
jgi:hypothetical protein